MFAAGALLAWLGGICLALDVATPELMLRDQRRGYTVRRLPSSRWPLLAGLALLLAAAVATGVTMAATV